VQKAILICLTALLILGIGVCIGIVIGKQDAATLSKPPQGNLPLPAYPFGNAVLKTSHAQWLYPNAHVRSLFVAHGLFGNRPYDGGGLELMATPDTFGKVAVYYEKLLNRSQEFRDTTTVGGAEAKEAGEEKEFTNGSGALRNGIGIVIFPQQAGVAGTSQKGKTISMALRSKNCTVNIVISRLPDEQFTFINLMYDQSGDE
jgi:hypothetical protein